MNGRINRRSFVRLSAVGAAGVLAAAALAGCGEAATTEAPAATKAAATAAATAVVTQAAAQPKAEIVTLRYLANPQAAEQKLNENFLAANPNIKLQVINVPEGESERDKLLTSFGAGADDYDFFLIDCIDVPQFAEAGWALDVTGRITEEQHKDAMPFALEGMAYKGRWYGLPAISEWKTWAFNLKRIKDAGFAAAPTTWDEYVEVSKAAMGKGLVKFGQHWGWKQGENLVCDYPALLASLGGKMLDDNLNLLVNQEAPVQALEMMIKWTQDDKIIDPASLTGDNTSSRNAQAAGDTLFGLHWGTPLVILNDPAKSKIPNEADIGLMPHAAGQESWTVSGPMGWSVTTSTKHPEEAYMYVEARAGKEGSKFLFVNDGTPFGWNSLWDDPDVKAVAEKFNVKIDVMREQAKHIINRPAVPFYNEFSAALQLELQKALTQQKKAQAAMDDAVTAYNEIKKKAGL